jgi:uncharacterized cupin superfamily protein
VLAHWDEVESRRLEVGHIAGVWRDLGSAAGSRAVGVQRIEVDAGKWSTPVHRQTAEEEIFFVLGGSGISLQDELAFEVRSGDCLVHVPGGATHTLRAGPDGLDVLAFGQRIATELAHLPRAGVARIHSTWLDVGHGKRPWEREAEAGEPAVRELSERPSSVVNVDDVEGEYGGLWKGVAAAAGSQFTGLNWAHLPPGEEGAPPHCHSAEEEIFVVLEGEGILELWPSPQQARRGLEYEEIPIRAGHVISRPAGTGIAHGIRTTDGTMTYLAYGTRDRKDVAYYPRSNKIFFRGVGVMARLEDLDYDDGEPG